MAMLKIGVLISGRGSNLKCLLDALSHPDFPAEIVCVIADREAAGLAFAKEKGISALTLSRKAFKDRQSFEEALKRLEALTQAMQSSEMPLEEALAAYQEGNELVQYCQNKLAEVEQKLHVLDEGGLKELSLEAE